MTREARRLPSFGIQVLIGMTAGLALGLVGRETGSVALGETLHMVGQVFAMFVLTVAAAEAAIGLAILVVYFRNRGSIAVEDINMMNG